MYTEPNPNIKYEFFTESIPSDVGDELSTNLNNPEPASVVPVKHSRRHHGYDKDGFHRDAYSTNGIEKNTGPRKFTWKILSYTQCSRSCGRGIQVSGMMVNKLLDYVNILIDPWLQSSHDG